MVENLRGKIFDGIWSKYESPGIFTLTSKNSRTNKHMRRVFLSQGRKRGCVQMNRYYKGRDHISTFIGGLICHTKKIIYTLIQWAVKSYLKAFKEWSNKMAMWRAKGDV